jgi:glycosyltransferase involved in cell wall biosynthesis
LNVSIIIPAYKAERYIEETLRSVFAQTHTDWEIIICEDGVQDGTAAVVKQLAPPAGQRIQLIQNRVNQGVSASRNRAFNLAKGDYIAFLDADDIWDPHYLENGLALLESQHADAVFSLVKFIDELGRELGRQTPITETVLRDLAASLYDYNFIQTASVWIMRRKWIDAGVRFDESLSYGEDLDVWLDLIARGAVIRCTQQHTCAYRKHETSAMAQTIRSNERLADFYGKHLGNPLLPNSMRVERLAGALFWAGRMQWRVAPRKAAALLRRSLQVKPFQPQTVFWFLAANAMNLINGKK